MGDVLICLPCIGFCHQEQDTTMCQHATLWTKTFHFTVFDPNGPNVSEVILYNLCQKMGRHHTSGGKALAACASANHCLNHSRIRGTSQTVGIAGICLIQLTFVRFVDRSCLHLYGRGRASTTMHQCTISY